VVGGKCPAQRHCEFFASVWLLLLMVVFLAKQLSLQTLRGFRYDLFFRISRGALPLLQVQEAEVPVFGQTAQGGESCSEG
jgi:hypothetical protein